MRSAILLRMIARWAIVVFFHESKARQAASTALSMSAALPRATSVKTLPLTGDGFSKYSPRRRRRTRRR